MAETAAILDLVSVDCRRNAWVDWFDFSVAYCGWLQVGSFRWSALPLIQEGRYGRHLGFGFSRLDDKRLGRFIRFFCDLLGPVTRGRFPSMINSAAHPRWLQSWIWFPSFRRQTPGSIHPIFLWLIGGDYRKVPFDDQLCRSSKMATPSWIWFPLSDFLVAHWGWLAWLEEGSFRWSAPPLIQNGRSARHLGFGFHRFSYQCWVHSGSDFLVAHWGNWRKVPFDNQRRRSSKMAATAAILDLVSVDYLTNTCVDWSDCFVAHWESSIFTMFHFSLSLIFHAPTDNFPFGDICYALRCPCIFMIFTNAVSAQTWT
jgi:hypothetical protein